MFWILFAVFIISTVLSYILAPKPQINNNPGMQTFASPTCDCNRVIPEVFGTVLINGNCIFYNGYYSWPIKMSSGGGKKGGGDQTVGYGYLATFAYGIATTLDAILEVRRSSQLIYPHVAWDNNGNEIYTAGNWAVINQNGQAAQMQTGVTSRVGGSGFGQSTVYFYLGTQTTPDPLLGGLMGGQAFTGTSYACFPNAFIGDNVQQIPQYSFTVQRLNLLGTLGGYNFASVQVLNKGVPLAGQLVGTASQIAIMNACIANYADVNPVNVILYILLNFLFISQGSIDLTSFWNAANTVYNEGIGVSFQMDSSNDVKKWIQEMLQIIDGVLYFNTQNGLYTIKLIRGGYSTTGLASITDDNSETIQFSRKSAENLPQAITITYTEKFSFAGTSATAYNNSLNMMSTSIKQQSFDFPAIASDRTAQVVLSRLIAKTTYPYASLTFTISRVAFENLNIGDVFLFSSASLGISNMCCRVMAISNENQYDQKITVEAIEDIFNTINTTFTPVAQRSVIPSSVPVTPGNLTNVLVWDAYQEMANTPSVIIAYAPPPNATNVKITIGGNYQGDEGALDWGYGVLASGFNATGVAYSKNEIDYTNTLTITAASAQNMVTLNATNGQFQRLTYTAIIIDTNNNAEIISFQTCVQNADGSWTISNIIRGLMNTTIQSHAAGSQIWIYWAANGNELPTYPVAPVSSVNVQLVPTNVAGVGNIYSATYTYKNIELTPYPVSNLAGTRSAGVTTLTWQNTIRLNGANYRDPDSFAAGEVQPEGIVQITCSQGTFNVTPTPGQQTWTINASASDTYKINVVLNGYISPTVQITV